MSIKVAVRVRPFNEREKQMQAAGAASQDSTIHGKCIVQMNGPMTTIIDPVTGQARPFTFDYSFYSHDDFVVNDEGINVPKNEHSIYADQNFVYQSLGEQVLDNAWQGYHCCLFAYGQTGSGKSYSMIGHGKNKGIVPKACDEIFKRIKANEDPNVQYQVQISMLEIYNEKVQDLLAIGQQPTSGLKVRELKKGEVYVQGLTKHPVDSYDAIAQKMEEGYMSRSIGSTLMNQTSSRAHTIITIEFKQIMSDEGRKTEKLSVINLVDLAGSEKSKQTGAEGQRLKEGCAINKSLTVLGNCISILAEKAVGKAKGQVVPYRDSNLTRILQNALGGNSKTIMICAISPSAVNYEESMSTLRYADRAKKIQNKAVINESVQDKIIRELKSENEKLKQLLMQASKDGNMSLDLSALDLDDLDLDKLDNLKGEQKEIVEQMMESQKQIQDMEIPWEQKLQQQRERDEEKKNQDLIQKLRNLRAPHLTNLNEDLQLSGKMNYSLEKCQDGIEFHIGRHDGDPLPNIILRGVGIQKNHAYITLSDTGIFELWVKSVESQEQTLVNGKRLTPITTENVDEQTICKTPLNHLDRIFIGVNTMFIFKYPLMRLKADEVREIVKIANPQLEANELEQLVFQRLQEQGVKTKDEQLVCNEEQYTQQHIDSDDANIMDFDKAYEEATLVDKLERRKQIDEQLRDQQQALDAEKQELENQYKKYIEELKQQEEKKITDLLEQQKQFQEELKLKEQSIKNIEQQSKQQLEEQELQAAKEAANKVDKSEVQKLQDKLMKIQKEIEKQQIETQKQFKSKQDKLQSEIHKKEAMIKKQSEKIFFELTSVAKEIKEANQICIMMGKNIKFKQCYIQMARESDYNLIDRQQDFTDQLRQSLAGDPTMREGTNAGVDLEDYITNQINEELQIRVQNFDKNSVVMWTIEQFRDRLEMLRDSLAQFEEKKQRKIEKQAAKKARREQRLLEAQSKKTMDDSFNNSQSHSSGNHNNSVFNEINQGDDFEQTIIVDNDDESSSHESSDSVDSTARKQKIQIQKSIERQQKESKQMVDQVNSNIESVIDAIQRQQMVIDDLEKQDNQEETVRQVEFLRVDQSQPVQIVQPATPSMSNNQPLDQQQVIQNIPNTTKNSIQPMQKLQIPEDAQDNYRHSFQSNQDNNKMIQQIAEQRGSTKQIEERKEGETVISQSRESITQTDQEPIARNSEASSLLQMPSGFNEDFKLNTMSTPVIQQTSQSTSLLMPNAPPYYNENFDPWDLDDEQIAMNKQFTTKLKGQFTPAKELVNQFMMPVPQEIGQIQCTIVREKKGLNKFWPKFTLQLSDAQKTTLMYASYVKTSKTPHLRIEIKTGNQNLSQLDDGGFIGRLRANYHSTEFYLFDNGISDDKKQTGTMRKQFGTVIYSTDKSQEKKPKRVQVYLPMLDALEKQATSWTDTELKKSNIGFEYKQQVISKTNEMLKSQVRQTKQKQSITSSAALGQSQEPQIMYFLSSGDDDKQDYHGRVTQPSKKNFQLTDDFDDKKVYLQFGRNGKETFNMDVSYPFSVFQAFGICLSTFDYKTKKQK